MNCGRQRQALLLLKHSHPGFSTIPIVKIYHSVTLTHRSKIACPQQTRSRQTEGGSGPVREETCWKWSERNRLRKDCLQQPEGLGHQISELRRDSQSLTRVPRSDFELHSTLANEEARTRTRAHTRAHTRTHTLIYNIFIYT